MEFEFELGGLFNPRITYRVYLVDPNGCPFEEKAGFPISVAKSQEFGICFERIVTGDYNIKEYPTLFSARIILNGDPLSGFCLPKESGRIILYTKPGNNNGKIFQAGMDNDSALINITLTPAKRPITVSDDITHLKEQMDEFERAYQRAATEILRKNSSDAGCGQLFRGVAFLPDVERPKTQSLNLVIDPNAKRIWSHEGVRSASCEPRV